MKEKLKHIIHAFILAGIIVLLIGMYYLVVKAGIPYQDPTLEMQIKYEINFEIGEILTRTGFIIAVCGGIVSLILKWVRKAKNK